MAVTYAFQCENLPEAAFAVARFQGHEGISQLYRFEIELVCDDPDLDIDALQSGPSALTIRANGSERIIQGRLAEVDIIDQVDEQTVYRVVLVPRTWELTLTSVNAVHLERSTPEVIRNALENRLNLTSVDYDQALVEEYPERAFRLQYGESDWDFLARTMERDGIYYYFAPGEGSEHIVFCDSVAEQPAIAEPQLAYTATLGMEHAEGGDDTVHALIRRQRRLPRRVWLQNYDDEQPSMPIREEAEVDPAGAGDVNIYGQNVKDVDEAQALARVRAEELYATKATYHGESTVFRLAAGHRFELSGHPRAESNREYQLLEVEHSGHDPRVAGKIGRKPDDDTPVYENRFTAIPADVQYRPAQATIWPRIHGTINALVDAEGDGRFAELDPEGRYRIVFPFHEGFRDPGREDHGKASHWVRLMQPYGGEKEGMHFPLRKGARVLVSFIGGNPDLPIISGVLPTTEQPSVTNAANVPKGTIKSPCGNLIEMDDENPRIKLQTPKCGTYFHLGSANEPGEGFVALTEGMSRTLTLGGSNSVVTTFGWPSDADKRDHDNDEAIEDFEAIYPRLASQHESEDLLAFQGATKDAGKSDITDEGEHDYKENDEGELKLETEAQIDWAKGKIFKFPNKHSLKDDDGDEDLEETNDHTDRDGRHDLMISRTVGLAYTYRAGIDYSFKGVGYESYDFGESVAYSSDCHEETAEAMRKVVSPVDASEDYTDKLESYQKEKKKYEDARQRYYELRNNDASPQALATILLFYAIDQNRRQEYSERQPINDGSYTSDGDWVDYPSHRLWSNKLTPGYRSAFTEHGELADLSITVERQNEDLSGKVFDDIDHTDPSTWDEKNLNVESVRAWRTIELSRDNYNQEFASGELTDETPYDANLAAVKDGDVATVHDEPGYLKDARKDMESKEEALEDAAKDLAKETPEVLRGSLQSFRDASYRRGSSYSEIHVDREEEFSGFGQELLHDRTKDEDGDNVVGGHEWRQIDAYRIGNTGDWLPGLVNVSKMIGNSYSFTKGHSVSVVLGDSESYTYRKEALSRTYDLDAANNAGEGLLDESYWTPTREESTSYHALTWNKAVTNETEWKVDGSRSTRTTVKVRDVSTTTYENNKEDTTHVALSRSNEFAARKQSMTLSGESSSMDLSGAKSSLEIVGSSQSMKMNGIAVSGDYSALSIKMGTNTLSLEVPGVTLNGFGANVGIGVFSTTQTILTLENKAFDMKNGMTFYQ